ncbi:hypothetical protein NBRC116591_24660 [Sessilibacter corallicola]|uniref:Uncharacterized protein n=1 Tax=Sessilibacter corallicola TaxID=2904075 RepID=A0ABQ0AAH3_9GAMM
MLPIKTMSIRNKRIVMGERRYTIYSYCCYVNNCCVDFSVPVNARKAQLRMYHKVNKPSSFVTFR